MVTHPRDTFVKLESIWISHPDYLHRRMPLEQTLVELSKPDLALAILFMRDEEEKLAQRLKNLRAIKTISQEVMEHRREEEEDEGSS